MKRMSRVATVTAAMFLVLALVLGWTGAQVSQAETMAWTYFGDIGGNHVSSLAWNGTTLYAGCFNGHVYSKTGAGSWMDTGATGNAVVYSLAWNGTTLYAGSGNGHVYSMTGAGPWADTGDTGGGYALSLAWNGADTLYAGCLDGHVYSMTGAGPWTDIGSPESPGSSTVSSLAWNGTDTLYAGCFNGNVYSMTGAGPWVDAGATGGDAVICLAWNGTDTIYAGCADGHVYSKTGAGPWTDTGDTGGGQVNCLAWNGTDTLYAGCPNGHVYSKTGAGPWADTGATGVLSVNGLAWNGTDTLYAGCYDGHVYAKTGAGPWTDTGTAGNAVVFSLAWNGTDTIYAGCADAHVYSKTGAGPWTDTGGPGISMPFTLAWNGTDTLSAGCDDGHVYAKTGAGPWADTGDTGGGTVSSLAWNGTTLYAGCDDGHVYAKTGAGPWADAGATGGGTVGSLAWNGTTLYAGCDDGHVYSKTGAGPWNDTGDTGGGTVNGLAWNGTTLYAGCDDGHVYAKTGAGPWTDTGDTGGSPVFSLVINGTATLYAGCFEGVFRGDLLPPTVTSIDPSTGTQGTTVSVKDLAGTGFYGTPLVKLKKTGHVDMTATNVAVVSSTRITCDLPIPTNAATGTWNLLVQNPDGQSATRTGAFTVTASAPVSSTWYLAEGTNAWGFNTYITIENPNNEQLTARLNYMDPTPASGSGVVGTRDVPLPPLSQTTVSSVQDIGYVDFSTKVECTEGKAIAVDRTMYWTGQDAPSPEGHSSIGTTAPSKTWYLPEGSSAWGFETWTLIQNPNATEATVTLTYMTENAGAMAFQKKVPAYSRDSFDMASDIGSHDSSTEVTSNVPVISERSQYRNNRREGSCSIGATTPAADYFLAEGTTAWGFATYVLIQNPNEEETLVTLTYMTPDGPVAQPHFTMAANSRRTIKVNDVPGVGNTDLSTQVHADKPIIAERAMYWGEGTPLGEACHDSVGLNSPHMSFYLPDGQTSSGWETWTLIQNPNPGAVTVEITYLPQNGGNTVTFTDEIPPGSRRTYNMDGGGDSYPGFQGRASIVVRSLDGARPVMVERAMYRNNRGLGTDTIGGFED